MVPPYKISENIAKIDKKRHFLIKKRFFLKKLKKLLSLLLLSILYTIKTQIVEITL